MNTTKRYLDTPKGIDAKKRANKKYRDGHVVAAPIRGNGEHVTKQLQESLALLAKGPFASDVISLTGTELWKSYCGSDNPFVTRAQYISYLPQMDTVPYHTRKNKRLYKPAFIVYKPAEIGL